MAWLTAKRMDATLPSEIKASLGFLASGNIHFAGHCAVLRLQGPSELDRFISFEEALSKAKAHLQSDYAPTSAPKSVKNLEPSTFVGHVARLALAVHSLAGFEGPCDPGWCEVRSDKSIAVFTCMDRG